MLLTFTALVASIGVSGCGSSTHPSTTGTQTADQPSTDIHIDLYASLPLTGTSAQAGQALLAGIKLAVTTSAAQVAPFHLRLIALDDSMPGAGWNASSVEANAKRTALDPAAVAYIGDLAAGAAKVSMPILNVAGVTQISPGSTYVGLTNAVTGVTAQGEPGRYAPDRSTTFVRMLPSDAVEAAAMLAVFEQAGCKQVAIVHGPDQNDVVTAALLKLSADSVGVSTSSDALATITAAAVREYGQQLRSMGSHCAALIMQPSGALDGFTNQLISSVPQSVIVGDSTLCGGGWRVAANLAEGAGKYAPECVSNLLSPSSYPGYVQFESAWQKEYPLTKPGSEQMLGYASAEVAISAIAAAQKAGDQREAVRREVVAGRVSSTVLGQIEFDAAGNSSLSTFAVYRLTGGARRKYLTTVTPTRWLTQSGS